jgi:hypothetical protein
MSYSRAERGATGETLLEGKVEMSKLARFATVVAVVGTRRRRCGRACPGRRQQLRPERLHVRKRDAPV